MRLASALCSLSKLIHCSLATGYLRNDGIDVAMVPEFADVAIDDKVRTAIKFVVEPRK